MKQLGLGLNLSTKKTRKRVFLEEMERVVPWAALVQIAQPHCPRAQTGRPPFAPFELWVPGSRSTRARSAVLSMLQGTSAPCASSQSRESRCQRAKSS